MTYQDAVTPVVVLWTKNPNNTLLAVHFSQPFLMVRSPVVFVKSIAISATHGPFRR